MWNSYRVNAGELLRQLHYDGDEQGQLERGRRHQLEERDFGLSHLGLLLGSHLHDVVFDVH
jgi:hypothetical protein